MCSSTFDEHHLPHFDKAEGETALTYLRHLCEQELPNRYGEITDELKRCLDYELGVINTYGL